MNLIFQVSLKNLPQIGNGFDWMLCIGHFRFLYASGPTFDTELYKPGGMSLELKITKSSFRLPQEHLKASFTTDLLFVSETNH